MFPPVIVQMALVGNFTSPSIHSSCEDVGSMKTVLSKCFFVTFDLNLIQRQTDLIALIRLNFVLKICLKGKKKKKKERK